MQSREINNFFIEQFLWSAICLVSHTVSTKNLDLSNFNKILFKWKSSIYDKRCQNAFLEGKNYEVFTESRDIYKKLVLGLDLRGGELLLKVAEWKSKIIS